MDLTNIPTDSLTGRRSFLEILRDGLNAIKNKPQSEQQATNITNGLKTICDELDCIELELQKRGVLVPEENPDGSLSINN